MKKKVLALLTAAMLLASGTAVQANVYSERQQRIADALYHVELFRGTNLGYELGRELTRVEGITLLVRMLGQEDAAMSKTYNLPFTDVADWAKPYVGYAYENGITNGISATEFGSNTTMTDYMFITLTLRALGYTDKGEAPQFVWNAPYVLANSAGLIGSPAADSFFTRGDAIEVFWNALSGKEYQMAYSLCNRGVFTADELEEAIDIYLYGKNDTEKTPSAVVKVEKPTNDDDDDDDHRQDIPFITDEDLDDLWKPAQKEEKPEKPSAPSTPSTPSAPSTPSTGDKDEGETSKPETPGSTGGGNETPQVPYEPEGPVSYDKYLGMSGEAQEAYFNTFDNPADFFAWLNSAKAEYDKLNPSIEIGGDGSIDIGDIIGKDQPANP